MECENMKRGREREEKGSFFPPCVTIKYYTLYKTIAIIRKNWVCFLLEEDSRTTWKEEVSERRGRRKTRRGMLRSYVKCVLACVLLECVFCSNVSFACLCVLKINKRTFVLCCGNLSPSFLWFL